MPIVAKNVGYELRCADPIPFDMEYARDLGACAATHVMAGGRGDMISMQGGRFVPIPLADVLDPDTGLVRMRMVDTTSTRYQIACRYMIRLRAEDLRDADECRRLAAVAGVSPAIFATEFRAAFTARRPRTGVVEQLTPAMPSFTLP